MPNNIVSGFFNSIGGDRTYDATDFSRYLEGLVVNGCLGDGFKIIPNPDPIGVNPPTVIVSAGKAYLNGMWVYNPTPFALEIRVPVDVGNGLYAIYLCFDTNDEGRTVTVGSYLVTDLTNPTEEIHSRIRRVGPQDGAGKYYLGLALVNSLDDNVQPVLADISDARDSSGVLPVAGSVSQLTSSLATYLVPVGSIHIWPSIEPPPGYLLCDGWDYNIADYPALAAILGTKFNYTPPGSGKFRVPDFKHRTPLGIDMGLGGVYGNIGLKGGSAANLLPAHKHALTTKGGLYVPSTSSSDVDGLGTTTSGHFQYLANLDTASTGTGDIDGHGYDNLPPYVIMSYIIKY